MTMLKGIKRAVSVIQLLFAMVCMLRCCWRVERYGDGVWDGLCFAILTNVAAKVNWRDAPSTNLIGCVNL